MCLLYACMQPCVHACKYPCIYHDIHMHVSMHVFIYAYMHVSMHVCTYACMHVCIPILALSDTFTITALLLSSKERNPPRVMSYIELDCITNACGARKPLQHLPCEGSAASPHIFVYVVY